VSENRDTIPSAKRFVVHPLRCSVHPLGTLRSAWGEVVLGVAPH